MKFKSGFEAVGMVSIDRKCYRPEEREHHLWISENEPDEAHLCQCGMYNWAGNQVNDKPVTDAFSGSKVFKNKAT